MYELNSKVSFLPAKTSSFDHANYRLKFITVVERSNE